MSKRLALPIALAILFTIAAPARGSTLGMLPRVLAGSEEQQAVLDPATHTIYVANAGDGTLSAIDARGCHAGHLAGCTRTAPTMAAGPGANALALDTATHTLYVTDGNADTVSVLDAATCNGRDSSGCGQTPRTVTVGPGPAGIAVDPATHSVYVTIADVSGSGVGDHVAVIDGTACNARTAAGCDRPPASVAVHDPFGLTLDPRRHTAYVSRLDDRRVTMIDTRTCNALRPAGCAQAAPSFATGGLPLSLATDRRTGTLYVGANLDGSVAVIDAAGCNAAATAACERPAATLHFDWGPAGIAVDETTERLFIAHNSTAAGLLGPGADPLRATGISILDATTCNAHVTTGCAADAPVAFTGANPGGMAVDETTGTLYTTTGDNALTLVDEATCNARVRTGCGQPTPATMGGADPVSLALDDATQTAYVGDLSGFAGLPWEISLFGTAACNTSLTSGCDRSPATVATGFSPWALAADPAGRTLYAARFFGSDSLAVIDTTRCRAGETSGCGETPGTATAGSAPVDVALDPAHHTAYVADSGEPALTLVDTAACRAACGTPLRATLSAPPEAVAVNPATHTVYALIQGSPGSVAVLDAARCNAALAAGCAPRATVTVGDPGFPAALAVDPGTDTVYADSAADGTVSVIDGATCNATVVSGCAAAPGLVAVGRQGFGRIAVDPATHLVYVTNTLDDTVSVIDGTECNGHARAGCHRTPPAVPAGANPSAVAVAADHTVYVADNAGGTVSFFRFVAPGRPSGVTATRAGAGAADLRWRAPEDGRLPIVYHVVPSPPCRDCHGLDTPATSGLPATTVTGLRPGIAYTFRVEAEDAAGRGPLSLPGGSVTP